MFRLNATSALPPENPPAAARPEEARSELPPARTGTPIIHRLKSKGSELSLRAMFNKPKTSSQEKLPEADEATAARKKDQAGQTAYVASRLATAAGLEHVLEWQEFRQIGALVKQAKTHPESAQEVTPGDALHLGLRKLTASLSKFSELQWQKRPVPQQIEKLSMDAENLLEQSVGEKTDGGVVTFKNLANFLNNPTATDDDELFASVTAANMMETLEKISEFGKRCGEALKEIAPDIPAPSPTKTDF